MEPFVRRQVRLNLKIEGKFLFFHPPAETKRRQFRERKRTGMSHSSPLLIDNGIRGSDWGKIRISGSNEEVTPRAPLAHFKTTFTGFAGGRGPRGNFFI